MQNGDISNRVANLIIFIDGCGFLYVPIDTWRTKLAKRFVFRSGNRDKILHCVQLQKTALQVVLSLMNHPDAVLKLLAYSDEEELVLTEIMGFYYLQHIVQRVRSKEEHLDLMKMADLFISNQFMDNNAPKRRITFTNMDQVVATLSQHVKWGAS